MRLRERLMNQWQTSDFNAMRETLGRVFDMIEYEGYRGDSVTVAWAIEECRKENKIRATCPNLYAVLEGRCRGIK